MAQQALNLTIVGLPTSEAGSLLIEKGFGGYHAGILNLTVPPSLFSVLDMLTARLVLVVLGKGGLAASSMCLSLYGGELFPTVIR